MKYRGAIEEREKVSGSILVVDDNPIVLLVTESILKSVGYTVFTSESGSAALQHLQAHEVDIIISDVMMPNMDGYALQERVRENASFSHIPFIFLTSLDDEVSVQKGKAAGVDDYITKPPDPEELLAVVRGKLIRFRKQKHFSEEQFDIYRKRIITTFSHEFLTPFIPLKFGMEMLEDLAQKPEYDELRRLLPKMLRGVARLEHLINDFILLQKINARLADANGKEYREIISLSAIAAECMRLHQRELEDKGFSLRLIELSDGATIRADKREILDILARLISNVVKFSGDSREIEIQTCCLESNAVIKVLDRGIGIEVNDVKQALEAFGQVDRDKHEQQGGGIGLAIVSGYATLNDGHMEIAKRSGGGSIVSIVLPVA